MKKVEKVSPGTDRASYDGEQWATLFDDNKNWQSGVFVLRSLETQGAHTYCFGIGITLPQLVRGYQDYLTPVGQVELRVGPGDPAFTGAQVPGEPVSQAPVVAPHDIPFFPQLFGYHIAEGAILGNTPGLQAIVFLFHKTYDNRYPTETPVELEFRKVRTVIHEVMHSFDRHHNCGNWAAIIRSEPYKPKCAGASLCWPLLELDDAGEFTPIAYPAIADGGFDFCAEHILAVRDSEGHGRE